MTPDQIREEAIERAAKAMAALECPGPPDHRHYATAEAMIDALGDMLPTDTEDGQNVIKGFTGVVIQRGQLERRYVGDWFAVPE